MKQASLYRLKKYVIEELFGGHDESYSHLPRYADMICATNPKSKAFVGWTLSESIPRVNLFTSMFISFAGQWKGFLAGCRPLIGVDGAHLKGNYGAYAVVSGEDKETWSYFLWQIYNIVKESGRKDWTIISDRQKGVDIALTNVWPEAKRRYCCRHLSRNYKKSFPGPLMYILFWRACNATNVYNFRKAMERLQKEGGADVMKWFADLGDQTKWSKHKFDPNVCNDSNTSNFVEIFKSTLGVDRCRPVSTLLEGIRRVCMLLREIIKATSTCRAYQSSPGEYEIHEGRSQFPLSLNNKICSCGAWQLSGIPCRHAIRVMLHAKVDPHNNVSSWYSAKTYKQVYCHAIHPIPDFSQWPPADPNHPNQIAPPKMKRGIGRPSRNRRREEGEEQPGKRARIVRCNSCGNFGHNKKTCKGGLSGKELKASEALVVKNPRVRDQSKAAKEAAVKSKAAGAATEISSSHMFSQP
ncbi:uncharacterized protein LOC110704226 [Chenopodium quinoa]|uniref:uncharacterized protein LOC110704226 n=1 Tax=Chenopodium quinoa TaxID=63459 RepID=UPI000B76E190|nr:uncharacterized protein LOC110704226 [Chenopodium quinoa]